MSSIIRWWYYCICILSFIHYKVYAQSPLSTGYFLDRETGIEFVSIHINQSEERLLCQYYNPSGNVIKIDEGDIVDSLINHIKSDLSLQQEYFLYGEIQIASLNQLIDSLSQNINDFKNKLFIGFEEFDDNVVMPDSILLDSFIVRGVADPELLILEWKRDFFIMKTMEEDKNIAIIQLRQYTKEQLSISSMIYNLSLLYEELLNSSIEPMSMIVENTQYQIEKTPINDLPYCYCQSNYLDDVGTENLYFTLFKEYNRDLLDLDQTEKFQEYSLEDISNGTIIMIPAISDYPIQDVEYLDGKTIFGTKIYDFNTFYEMGNIYFSEINRDTE